MKKKTNEKRTKQGVVTSKDDHVGYFEKYYFSWIKPCVLEAWFALDFI